MSITSYAQNFEDVILWRALGHISNGFYIDVGAQHPVIDSVSKAFYEQGWRGLHVEATPVYANLVRADRPDELVLEVALSDKPGSLPFYEIPDTGLSTGDASIAEHHRSCGFNVVETIVNCITLADVFGKIGQQDVHWLKIDVEGMEAQVLTGWGDCPARPWVLVVESTYPNSQVETHQAWEEMLLARDYIHTYFDGLSRYYVLANRPDLLQKFGKPPNIFDGFSLAPSSPYTIPSQNLLRNAANELLSHTNLSVEREAMLNHKIATLQQQVQRIEEIAAESPIQMRKLLKESESVLFKEFESEELLYVERQFDLQKKMEEQLLLLRVEIKLRLQEVLRNMLQFND
jgi:FkbM family methyltransferase